MQTVWQTLYNVGAELVLSGHEHNYERFALQTPDGVADPVHGIREFVVGTGGAGLGGGLRLAGLIRATHVQEIEIRPVPAGLDLILERRSLAEKADMFQEIYGLDVHLEEAGGP